MPDDLHRLRLTVDVIYQGPRLSPSAARGVARELSTPAHVMVFEHIKNVAVQYRPPDQRVYYAHHHESDEDGYCRVRGGCLEQAQDNLNQENL